MPIGKRPDGPVGPRRNAAALEHSGVMSRIGLWWDIARAPKSRHNELLRQQRARTRRIVRYARHASPFYREGYRGLPDVDLAALPPVSKGELMASAVFGRDDELLRMPGADGAGVSIVPMAIAALVEETPGVRRFQIVQTAPKTLTVRVQTLVGADRAAVWIEITRRLDAWLRTLGVTDPVLILSPDPPQRNVASGKFREVWAAKG